MKAIIYFSQSKKQRSKEIAETIKGDLYELLPATKIPKFFLFKMFFLGMATRRNKKLDFDAPKIDFDKYEEVVLVFPIWASGMAQFMKCYLDTVPFKHKKVTIIATSDSGKKGYILNLTEIVHESNDVVDIVMYKKNQLTM